MTAEEVLSEIAKKQPTELRYLMGTTAHHQIGEISRKVWDCFVTKFETDKFYVGNWVCGMGFVNVLFPKETSREMTEEEKLKHLNNK